MFNKFSSFHFSFCLLNKLTPDNPMSSDKVQVTVFLEVFQPNQTGTNKYKTFWLIWWKFEFSPDFLYDLTSLDFVRSYLTNDETET